MLAKLAVKEKEKIESFRYKFFWKPKRIDDWKSLRKMIRVITNNEAKQKTERNSSITNWMGRNELRKAKMKAKNEEAFVSDS